MKKISLLPDWIRNYQRSDLRFDLIAGLTVGVMLIPQGMAYAMVAGLPPVYGLYASTLPAIVYAWFGSSRHLSVGPGAMTALLTASGIGLVAINGTPEYLVMVTLLTLSVGTIQLTLGLSRLGFLVNFLSTPIILGFTSAAAIIIGLSQLKHLLGISIAKTEHIQDIIVEVLPQLSNVHILTLLMGICGILTLVILQKILPRVPAALIMVTIAILVTWLFRLDHEGIKIAGYIPGGLPKPQFTGITPQDFLTLLPTASAIALVSFMESTAVARAIHARHKNYELIPNRELIALGLANMVSGFFKSQPVTGGMSRSTVNDQAGARTGLSTIISALLILLTLLFLTSLFYYLPHAILAAVIIVAVTQLLKIKEAKRLWYLDRKDFWMMMITFTGTLFLGIGPGVGIGVILSLIWIIFEVSYPHHAELGRVPNTQLFRNTRRFKDLQRPEGVLIFRFDAPLFFANIDRFRDILNDYKNKRKDKIHSIIIDMESINTIDSSAIDVFSDMVDDLGKENIQLLLSEVKGPLRDKFYVSGLTHKIGEHHFFVTIRDALDYSTGVKNDDTQIIALQTNASRE